MALGFSVVFVALSLWLLPRLKGVFVGLQWAKRMHGFGGAGPALPAAADAGPPVRDAATVILVRRDAGGPQVLMGQRGGGAAFMPDKFVFPGGAVDPEDLALDGDAAARPGDRAGGSRSTRRPSWSAALPLAAVRELWEETGLMLGRPDPGAAAREVPASWRGFFAAGWCPTPRRCASSSAPSRRRAGRAASTPASSSPRPRRSPAPRRLRRRGRRARATCSGSTSRPPARCRCRSSPRWCSPSSGRSSTTPTPRGRCPSSPGAGGPAFRLL